VFDLMTLTVGDTRMGWKWQRTNMFFTTRAKEYYLLLMHRTPLIEMSILIRSFPDYVLVHQFSQKGWIGACDHSQGVYPEVVREFYANIEPTDLDFDSRTLRSTVRGVVIEFSILDIADLLGAPIVPHPQYPLSANQFPRDVEIRRELTNGAHCHRAVLREDNLTPHYRVLHCLVVSFIDPINPLSDISIFRCQLLSGISRDYTFDLPRHIWSLIARFGNSLIHGLGMPFFSIIMCIYTRFVPTYGNELLVPPPCEIYVHTYPSTALSPDISSPNINHPPIPEPQYPDLEPTFTHIHSVEDHVAQN
ncbi:hypothetical protein U1Q18_037523, partial [Sarracenia purpurea var. burkii]